MSHYHDVLSPADIEYIMSFPDVLLARERINSVNEGSMYFKITLTDSLRSTLLSRLNLDLSSVNEIPMRWIKGDTVPHVDKGKSEFKHTYLVYLNDSEGEFILEDSSFPIQKNTGFVFDEGLLHKTMNTGSEPRLLLGPMNEMAESVGGRSYDQAIYYYPNRATAEIATSTNENQIIRNPNPQTDLLGFSETYVVGHRNAALYAPTSLAIDSLGNLYSANNDNIIRKITPNGIVSTITQSTTYGHLDGPINTALFGTIRAIAFYNNDMYIADAGNSRIRKITPGGIVSTLAGSGEYGSLDGSGDIAQFNPFTNNGLVVDTFGNLYAADDAKIRKITPNGTVSTLAGSGEYGFLDGSGDIDQFNVINGISIDSNNNIYVADNQNNRIRKITPGGEVSTFAGTGVEGSSDDLSNAAQFNRPQSVACYADIVYVSEDYRIRKITSGTVTTLAGTGEQGYVDGPGNTAQFYWLRGICLDADGNLYVADQLNTLIRKITPGGIVSTVAGSSTLYGYKDTDVSLPSTNWKIASNSTGSSNQALVYTNGQSLISDGIYYLYPMESGAVCFLEGTTVLCLVDYTQVFLPIEKLTRGVLVKTSRDGYKKIELIAKEEMNNPGTDERIENRLYTCKRSKYPELTSDLFITGCHSILVDTITDEQTKDLTKQLGRIFVTDTKYRLTAYADERAEPWNSEGKYTVWHIVLENENPVMNYGIYVNGGLLVESCSRHVLKNKSNMILQ